MKNKSVLTLLSGLAGAAALLSALQIGQADDDLPEDPITGTLFGRSEELRQFAEQTGFVPPAGPPAEAAPLPGDLNDDGQVNGDDFTLFAQCQTAESGDPVGECPDTQEAAADFNEDGVVDVKDFRRLLKHEHDANP